MPVDFDRVPPRVNVPPAPKPSVAVWLALLIFVLGAGAALMIITWPEGRPTSSLWFAFCAVGYPFIVWAFLLCSRLAYGYVSRHQAIAVNRVSAEAEQACHDLASRPLAVLGHAWCFSANEAENAFSTLRSGTTELKSRLSGAVPDTEVNARWFDVPDLHFYPGNELSEHTRHSILCRWLLTRLIDGVAPQLSALAPGTKVLVESHVQSRLKREAVAVDLRQALAGRVPNLQFQVTSGEQAIPLFRADAWHDNRKEGCAHLLVAIQLRDAISATLSDGVAEAGVALLVGSPRLASTAAPSTVRLHRPAKGAFGAIGATVALATRWGRAPVDGLKMRWTHGLSPDQSAAVRHAGSFSNGVQWRALETSVGDCAGVGPWLAAALAAEGVRTTGEPQLVLCGDGEEITALVCRKQT